MRAFAALAALSVASMAGPAAQSGRPAGAQAGVIVGQVVDAASRRPVSGAVVALSGDVRLPDGRPLPTSQVLATADGRFVFRDLPAGKFGISATKPGYADGAYGRRRPTGSSQQVSLGAGQRLDDVVILLWKHAAISGTVTDEAGEPVVNAVVVAYRRSTSTGTGLVGSTGAVLTDDRGVYRFGGLQPGDYIVGVSVRHLSMPASRTFSINVERRVMGFDAFSYSMSASPPSLMQVGDALYAVGGGSAVPPPPADGRMFVYETTYYPSTTSVAQASLLTISSGEERTGVDIQLIPVPATRVSGSIGGPEGVHAASVRLVPADAREAGFDVEGPQSMSDTQGSFTFPAVTAGEYVLQARTAVGRWGDPGTLALWADVALSVGDSDITGLQVHLQRGLRITGRFEFEGSGRRPTAERLQQVPVIIQATAGRSPLPPSAVVVDADGRFTGSGLAPGRYFVRINSSPPGWRFKSAMHDGRDVADVPLDLRGDSQVVIAFSDRWSHLRGRVSTFRGEPDPEAIVLLFPTDTLQWPYASANSRRFKSARATASGEYALSPVPEGEYFVVAIPDVDASDWQTPTVLETLARVATRVTIAEGEARTERLKTETVR
jgi:hypothetical protein